MGAKLIENGGCVNNEAYKAAAEKQADAIQTEAIVQAAIQAGLLIWQNYAQGVIADLRQQLADRRMKMAEEVLAHAQVGWVEEAALVSDVMGTSAVGPEYSVAAAVDGAVEEAWANADNGFDSVIARFGLSGTTACEDHRVSRGMAVVKTDLVSHMLRTAEGRAIALNDRRFSRQLTVLGMGRGFLEAARSMGQLGAGREVVRNAIIGTINSAMLLWGYQDTRWQRGGNWATGNNGAPRVVANGYVSQMPEFQDRTINVTAPVQTAPAVSAESNVP